MSSLKAGTLHDLLVFESSVPVQKKKKKKVVHLNNITQKFHFIHKRTKRTNLLLPKFIVPEESLSWNPSENTGNNENAKHYKKTVKRNYLKTVL